LASPIPPVVISDQAKRKSRSSSSSLSSSVVSANGAPHSEGEGERGDSSVVPVTGALRSEGEGERGDSSVVPVTGALRSEGEGECGDSSVVSATGELRSEGEGKDGGEGGCGNDSESMCRDECSGGWCELGDSGGAAAKVDSSTTCSEEPEIVTEVEPHGIDESWETFLPCGGVGVSDSDKGPLSSSFN
jgi:hypothetical protein